MASTINKSSFKPIFINKDVDVRERLKTRLNTHWMFKKLDEEDKHTLIDTMRQETYSKGDIVIMEGDPGNSLYIVDQGNFDCVKIRKAGIRDLLKVYNEGELQTRIIYIENGLFGELALIYNCARTATIIANSDQCSVFSLDRQTFNYVVRDN